MDNNEMQKKCETLLKEFGKPSFVVFGWQKSDKQFGVVYSQHNMPAKAAAKSMSWALNDIIQKNL